MHPWLRLALPALLLAWPLAALRAQTPPRVTAQLVNPQHVTSDAQSPTTPFPRFREQIFGSGRAILSIRQSYRDDIRAVHKVANFRYDGLLANGVRPVVKISFMPKKLAFNPDALHPFVDPGDHGTSQTLDLALRGVPPNAKVTIQLNQEAALAPPTQTQLHDGKLTIELSPNALLLIKVQP